MKTYLLKAQIIMFHAIIILSNNMKRQGWEIQRKKISIIKLQDYKPQIIEQ